MAYFPNGTAGDILDDQCSDCHLSSAPCPVLWVQMEYNYKQLVDGEETMVSEVLNCLVDEKGTCKMKQVIDRCYE